MRIHNRSRMGWALALLAALTFFGMAPAADATIVRALPLPMMAAQAHDIIRGRVTRSDVVWDGRMGSVYTHTEVLVLEGLSDGTPAGETIIIRQIGGVLDGIETKVVGVARLEVGDEVVLFTRGDGALHYLMGMAQGAWFVQRDASGTARLGRHGMGLSHPTPLGPARALLPVGQWMAVDEVRALIQAVRP